MFAGAFTVTDLEALSGRADLTPAVAELVSAGWLHRTEAGLSLYTIVRQFLDGCGAVPRDAVERHRGWLFGWAPAAQRGLRVKWDPAVHRRLVAAAADLRRALATAEADDQAVPLLLALHPRVGDGSVLIATSLAEIEQAVPRLGPDSRWWPDLLQLRGLLLARTGASADAVASIRAALDRLAPDSDPRLRPQTPTPDSRHRSWATSETPC